VNLGSGLLEGGRHQHARDGADLEIRWQLDGRGEMLEYLAELAERGYGGLAVGAGREVAPEFRGPGGGQGAKHPVRGVRMSEIGSPLRRH